MPCPLNYIFFPCRWKQYKLSLSLVKKRFRDFSHFLWLFCLFVCSLRSHGQILWNTKKTQCQFKGKHRTHLSIYNFIVHWGKKPNPVAYFVTNSLSYHHVYALLIIQQALESHANILGVGEEKLSWHTAF